MRKYINSATNRIIVIIKYLITIDTISHELQWPVYRLRLFVSSHDGPMSNTLKEIPHLLAWVVIHLCQAIVFINRDNRFLCVDACRYLVRLKGRPNVTSMMRDYQIVIILNVVAILQLTLTMQQLKNIIHLT